MNEPYPDNLGLDDTPPGDNGRVIFILVIVVRQADRPQLPPFLKKLGLLWFAFFAVSEYYEIMHSRLAIQWQQAISTLIHQSPEPGLELGTLWSAFSALSTIPRLTASP